MMIKNDGKNNTSKQKSKVKIMSKQIVRTKKLTSKNQITGSGKHNFREQETPNADPTKAKSNLFKGPQNTNELIAKFENRFAECAKNEKSGKLRKNAVLGLEYLITASPDFANAKAMQNGSYFKDAVEWLEERHGKENIISLTIHRDETTPHLVAYVVPADRTGKLNCRSFTGGSQLMSEMQTNFNEKVGKKYGLERGEIGSKAKHVNIRDYYKKVNQALPAVVTKVPVVPDATLLEKVKAAAGFDTENTVATEQARLASEQRAKEIKARQEAYFAKAKQFDIEKSNFNAAKKQNEQLKTENSDLKNKLRSLDLKHVLSQFGALPDPKDKNNFKTTEGRLTVDGNKFFNHDTKTGGGGAIDLVMHLANCDFKTAIATLAGKFGTTAAAAEIAHSAIEFTQNIEKTVDKADFSLPADVAHNWPGVKKWLMQDRKIPEKIIDDFRARGLLRADDRGNVIFANATRTGGEIRGRGKNFKGYRGKKNSLFIYDRSAEKSVLVVESGTDAMAFCAKNNGFGKIISTGGDFGTAAINELKALQNKGFRICVGTDNDTSGEQKFKTLAKELGLTKEHRLAPQARDWQQDMLAKPALADAQKLDDEHDEQRLQQAPKI